MQILRKASFKPVPWKNGGGITHELFRVDAADGDFLWRISVARIDGSGPFSEFAAHRRFMVLLQGLGLRLRFADGTVQTLQQMGDTAAFDGAVGTDCELLDGPCMDLNLMVSKALRGVNTWVRDLRESWVLPAHAGTRVVFAVSGSVVIENAAGQVATLAPWDLGVTSNPEAHELRGGSSGAMVFVATLDPNGG